jgi:hypothetical protein
VAKGGNEDKLSNAAAYVLEVTNALKVLYLHHIQINTLAYRSNQANLGTFSRSELI